MLRRERVCGAVVCAILLLLLIGCGGSSAGGGLWGSGSGGGTLFGQTNTKPTLSVSPGTGTMVAGANLALSANITNANSTDLSWTASAGTIKGTGTTVTYTAPSVAGTYTITATIGSANLSATSTITVNPAPPPATPATVTVTPATATVVTGTTLALSATISGAAGSTLTWTSNGGSVAATGNNAVFTAPTTAGTYIVTATTSNGSFSGTSTITVTNPPPAPTTSVVLAIAPSTASVSTSTSLPLTVSVTGATPSDLAWTATGGTISGSGTSVTYQAPATAGTFTVTVASASAAVSSTATITVTAPPAPTLSATISTTTATLSTGGTIPLSVNVTGATNPTIAWTATGGTITGSGASVTYTAPAAPGSYVVTATITDTVTVAGARGLVRNATQTSTTSVSTTITVAPAPTPLSVSVSPSVSAINTGATVALIAAVSGSTTATVGWSASSGTVAPSSGTAVTFTAPGTPGTYTVTATATETTTGKTATAIATITVTSPPPPPPTPTVTVSPSTSNLLTGASLGLTATLTNTPDATVTWSASGGTISGSGTSVTYTAPNTAGTFTITATNPTSTASGSAVITVSAPPPPPNISVNPSSTTVFTNASVPLSATVTGSTNFTVTFTANSGTVATSGTSATYTAPATAGTYTVTAKVTDNTTLATSTASSTITVSNPPPPPPPLTISVSPSTASILTGGTVGLAATVGGSTTATISWTASGGTVGASGPSVTYTAPGAAGTYTVTATATDSSTSQTANATATITVSSPPPPPPPTPVVVTVSPSTGSLSEGATLALTATISGTSNTSVTWTATGGTITGTGTSVTYTAPATTGTFTVTATSAAGGTAGTAVMTVTAPPPPPAPTPIVVTVSPTTATMQGTTSLLITATVTGTTNTAVTWSTDGGTISGTGSTVSYTAPNTTGTFHVIATSTDPSGASGQSTITVTSPPQIQNVTITLLPSNSTMIGGSSQPFTASVSGTQNTAVTWSLQPVSGGGTITGTGLVVQYQAPLVGGQYSVIVTSQADTSKSAFATITVPLPTVTISPTSATVPGGGSQPFSATAGNTTATGVSWSATGGTVSATGNNVTYTAGSTPGTYAVTATSLADPSVSASAAITIPTVSISVTPTSANVIGGATQSISATVTGSTNTNVTWTVSGGTFTGTGTSIIYTAPFTPGTYTVTATSAASPTQKATATITVPTFTVSVSPGTATIYAGGAQPFTASLSNTNSTSVTWSVSPIAGTISGTGLSVSYIAPGTPGTYVLTATSTADPTRKASATITVLATTVAITPSSATIVTGETVTLLTSINGQTSSAITMSTPTGGTLSGSAPTFTYTAPSVPGTYSVTATSTADSTKLNTATIKVVDHSLTIYEADGISQTNRPISFGRVFIQGEIAQCPQPLVGGIAVSNYQADVRNRWPDGSVRFAVISFTTTLLPLVPANVTFQNTSSCNNTGFLTQSQMASFNSGNWDGDIEVTANGTTQTADAKTMLNALTLADCKLEYLLQGPVVTQVKVQDCTATTAFDFGWSWNGTTMTSPVTGNAPTASLHPIFILSFYPGSNSVKIDYILENNWTGRGQDQQYSLVIKAGSPLTTVYSKPLFTHIYRARWHKTFWSGTAPGHIRIDHNFPYLIATKALPNYDLANAFVDPSSLSTNNPCSSSSDYNCFASGDKGDIGGSALFIHDYASNNEGALLQREDLDYLYNMGTCGVENGKCAQAWDILTGEVDANPLNTLVGVPGGGGMWNTSGNIPFHMRESRTDASTFFYCPGYASKDATPKSACGGTVVQTGRQLSRDAYQQAQTDGIFAVKPIGTWSLGPWSVADCAHWLDYSYVPYLLTGDWFFQDEEYHAASFCINSLNSDGDKWHSNGIFAYMNPSDYTVERQFAWGMLAIGHAGFIAPDGSVEQSYFQAKVNSNLEVQEGFMSLTGTNLTPTDTSCSAASLSNYNYSTANRWNWGRCTVASHCVVLNGSCSTNPQALHQISGGETPLECSYNITDPTKTTDFDVPWMYNFVSMSLGHLVELGYTNALPVYLETGRQLAEQVQDTTYNPYLVAAYERGIKSGTGTCTGSTDSTNNPYFTSWSALLNGFTGGGFGFQNINTFDQGSLSQNKNPYDYGCVADHGYSLVARAAGSFLMEFNASSSDPNCPNGTCSAVDAWNWINVHVPFYNNTPLGSTSCTKITGPASDIQIKFAVTPR